MPFSTDGVRRRHAAISLALVALLCLVLAAVVGVLVSQSSPASRPAVPQRPSGLGEISAEDAVAMRPMVTLPVQAALPHALSTEVPHAPIVLPGPTEVESRWIPGGFPATAEGAVAQLAVASETAFDGADPAIVARAQHAVSWPGAPNPATSVLFRTAVDLRAHAGLPETGPVPGLVASYDVTHGLIKGSTDGGRFVVVCVLGEVTVDYRGTSARAGLGDCQAMRFWRGRWAIAVGPRAATAPSAWPGSAEARRAGYRELRDA